MSGAQGETGTREHSRALTLRDQTRVLWRHRWIIACTALLIPAAAVGFSLRQTPIYRASAQVLVSSQDLAAILTGVGTSAPVLDPDRLVQTQADLASVPDVAQRVLTATHIHDLSVSEFLANATVTPKTDSDMLIFAVDDPDPGRAELLATSFARQYTLYRRKIDTAGTALAVSEASRRLKDLRAAGEGNSSLYGTLAEKVQTLQTMEALQTSNAFVVRTADGAAQVSPRPVRNGVAALILGLVVGIGLAFLWEAFDTRIRSADEIGTALGLPLLARLAAPPRRLTSKDQLVTIEEPASPGAEAFRLLRANLDFVSFGHDARSILMVSAVGGEGKSTTAANLAVTLARAGRKVALIDLDLRRPTLHRFFKLDSVPGLTNVLIGQVSVTEASRTVLDSQDETIAGLVGGNRVDSADPDRAWSRLEVLPSGSLAPHPGELVGTESVASIIDDLGRTNDVVIVDTPPLLTVGDALTLTTRVDAVIVVAGLAVLRRPQLRELRRVLQASPARPLGFVLTGAEAEEGYYGDQMGYYYYSEPPRTRTDNPRSPA